ncbi:hypothetical protein CXF85_16875 [Colwellia sp. 75C3]|uniref:TFIIB-type zinc ribbon-containing protein n=1 Tax=Colwellia sp. 75C3 TaxID=888425 RepID=UPI000C34649A|nr:zf-TFIIB domain-containing protein [Colwellia sp. 75C3]PKG81648.1 hypothetical protein CXF85_16875 [Colwellia sp. 75C3]
MKCPECKLSFIIIQRQSLEVNECPQCHGVWLKSEDIAKMTIETQLIEEPEQNRSNNLTSKENAIPTKKPAKKRKIQHFLSGAFDIGDDW